MIFLDQIYFGNKIETWIIALSIVVLSFLALKIILRIGLKQLARFAKRTETHLDDLLAEVLHKTRNFFLLIVAVYVGLTMIHVPARVETTWHTIVVLASIAQVAFWVSGGIAFWLGHAVKKRMAEDAASATTISVLGFISKLILWSITFLLMLDNAGVNITSLIAGLGIGGIAVALAIQNILGDLFASLSIVIDKPFVIGDFIVVDKMMGTVEHIGLKTTRVRSVGGEQLVFSNNDLLRSRIRNFRKMSERRAIFTFGVTYQTPPEKMRTINNIVTEIITALTWVRLDRVHFKEYGESALNFEVVYYVTKPDYNLYMDIQQTINLELLSRFHDEGIDFAYPTRTIFIPKECNSAILSPKRQST